MSKLGKCYSRAYEIARTLKIDLVHGIVTNPSGTVITHAWNEYEKYGIWFVYDYSSPELGPIHGPRIDYYVGYKISSATRYSHDQAFRMLNEADHYGPWDMDSISFINETDPKHLNGYRGISKTSARFIDSVLKGIGE